MSINENFHNLCVMTEPNEPKQSHKINNSTYIIQPIYIIALQYEDNLHSIDFACILEYYSTDA
jgi:hypothetical protein